MERTGVPGGVAELKESVLLGGRDVNMGYVRDVFVAQVLDLRVNFGLLVFVEGSLSVLFGLSRNMSISNVVSDQYARYASLYRPVISVWRRRHVNTRSFGGEQASTKSIVSGVAKISS